MMKMMKRDSIIASLCLAVLVSIFAFHLITLKFVTNSSRTEERRGWNIKVWRRSVSPLQSEPNVSLKCDRSKNFDLCYIGSPTVLDPTRSTFFVKGPTTSVHIRPYTRKRDRPAMAHVKQLALTSGPLTPQCQVQHNAPALVFSVGGYTGNFFHAFNDGFVPLFITVNSLFDGQDVILVVADCKSRWPIRYARLLSQLSRHPIINMNNETVSHCFPYAIVGLISHGPMIVDPTLLPHPKTMLDFNGFLANAYSQDQGNASLPIRTPRATRPRLILVGRRGKVGRVILNQAQVKHAAESIGFDVILFQPSRKTRLTDAFRLINPSHAMIGVHGAGLTHSLFLRPGSVLLQVVPIGTQWLSKAYFEKPAKSMGFEYIEYRIKAEESSLIEKYGRHGLVLTSPKDYVRGNWSNMRLYLKEQNVNVDMLRFHVYLKKAYDKAKKFMDKAG